VRIALTKMDFVFHIRCFFGASIYFARWKGIAVSFIRLFWPLSFTAVAIDPAFVADYRKITGEAPDFLGGEEVEHIFDRIRNVAPEVKAVLKGSINKE
jgi:hypothetical protein